MLVKLEFCQNISWNYDIFPIFLVLHLWQAKTSLTSISFYLYVCLNISVCLSVCMSTGYTHGLVFVHFSWEDGKTNSAETLFLRSIYAREGYR